MPTHDQQDLAGLSAAQLCEEICSLAGQIAAATCRWLLLLAEFDRRGEWSDGETKTCADWLSWRCSIMPATAREQLRVARSLRELPRISAAFASGVLSYSKVRAITRIAEPATEEQLVMLAEHASGAVLERLVRGYRRAASACLETANDAYQRRYVRWEWAEDGSLQFRGRLPAEDGALLVAALHRAEQQLEHDAPPPASAPAPVPAAVSESESADEFDTLVIPPTPEGEDTDTPTRHRNRAADALVSVIRTALAAEPIEPTEPAELAEPAQPAERRTRSDPFEVVVHVDAETLSADAVADRTDLEDGPSLAPETVRRLACDASVVRIVERDGRPLTAGRRTRTIPPALRRALRSRDGCCRFPGCTHSRFLHAHHVRHWVRGGLTDISNLVMLCSQHHRLVHEGGYTIELDDPRDGPGAVDPRRHSRRARRAKVCQARCGSAGPTARWLQTISTPDRCVARPSPNVHDDQEPRSTPRRARLGRLGHAATMASRSTGCSSASRRHGHGVRLTPGSRRSAARPAPPAQGRVIGVR